MNLKFHRKKITGFLTVLPSREITFEDEMQNYNFSAAKSMKLKMAMGYNKHRVVDEGTCVSDLCIYGLNYLLENGLLRKEDIDALLLVTQSPDYQMPPTSNIIQGKLGLGREVICMDINQGCCGFIIGLTEAFMLLEQEEVNKVVLLNADVLSRKVSKRDRNSNPLIGDAATITVIEKSDSVMKGDEVFNFVQREVPPLIEDLLYRAACGKEEVDWYMFHQPNRFMLHKLADKLGVPHEKMPSNIVENFGNASGATIPTNISFNIGGRLKQEQYMFCLAGFGVGLTWGALLMKIGNLDFNEIIYY